MQMLFNQKLILLLIFIITLILQSRKHIFMENYSYDFLWQNYHFCTFCLVLSYYYYINRRLFETVQMQKQILQQKQQIIGHIQSKLQHLRAQRNQLQIQKYSGIAQGNITDKRAVSAKRVKASQVQKIQLQHNLQHLKQLYDAKKDLRKAGINTDNVAEIYKYKNDPKWSNFVQRKKEKMAQNQQKMKVINEQMAKAQRFLKSKNVANKQLTQLQQMNYKNILKNKQQQLRQYEQLVNTQNLNRVKKQDLIQITFQLLSQWNKVVKKPVFKNFLLANPQFCSHFYITHSQINRDLQVVQTKQQGNLDYIEFLQFIKSIQLTNLNLNPSIKRKLHSQKNAVLKQNKQLQSKLKLNPAQQSQKQQIRLNNRQVYRKILQYLRKVFKNLDRANQSIVDRTKFVVALQKAMFLDAVKDKHVSSQFVRKLSNFIKQKTKAQTAKNYYKQLDSKYINFGEIQKYAKECYNIESKNRKGEENQEQLINEKALNCPSSQNQYKQEGTENQIEDEQDGRQLSELSSEIDLSERQGKIITQKDYVRYGWGQKQLPVKQQNKHNPKNSIQKLDQYYQEITQKYGNEIAWGGFGQGYKYKQDFKELEAFIQSQDTKHKQFHKKCMQQSLK